MNIDTGTGSKLARANRRLDQPDIRDLLREVANRVASGTMVSVKIGLIVRVVQQWIHANIGQQYWTAGSDADYTLALATILHSPDNDVAYNKLVTLILEHLRTTTNAVADSRIDSDELIIAAEGKIQAELRDYHYYQKSKVSVAISIVSVVSWLLGQLGADIALVAEEMPDFHQEVLTAMEACH